MKTFKIDARALKAAMVTVAKDDVRYYLEGILIGNGSLVSTDGHRMTIVNPRSDSFLKKMKPEIFKVFGQIPSSAINANFVYIDEKSGVIFFTGRNMKELNQVVKFQVVDGRFPDYERVIPTGEPTKVDMIGFNLAYMSDVEKVGKSLGGKFNSGAFKIYDKKTVIELSTPEHEAKCIIMAVRL